MFHNILVCVDGSSHSERALEEAIDLAEAGHGRLTLLTAIPRPPCWACSPTTFSAIVPLTQGLEQEAEQILREAADRVPQSVPITTVLSQQPIREALTHRLGAGQHDVLVMGSRGRGALTASLMGSVSHFALHHAEVPVLIVHTGDEAAADQPVPEKTTSAVPVSVAPA